MPLISSFFALAVSVSFGSLVVFLISQVTKQSLPRMLIIGSGLSVGLATGAWLLTLTIQLVPSLQLASWLVIALQLVPLALWAARANRLNLKISLTAGRLDTRFSVYACALTLIIIHLVITILNNTTREIFPWDAFTTWLYRAKAWVYDDQLTTTMNSLQWILLDGPDAVPLYANHYPTLISEMATMVSALSGQWSATAASLPWTAAGLALVLSVWGLLQAAGVHWSIALAGATATASLPLLNMHWALAGYADLWLSLSSGVGLALLILWAKQTDSLELKQRFSNVFLLVALILLIVGTQTKLEGWLWLAIGIVFVFVASSRMRVLLVLTTVMGSTAILLVAVTGNTSVELWNLGVWGLSESSIHMGFLGSYGIRIFNPSSQYIDGLFFQKNFSLLILFYAAALFYLVLKEKKTALPHWIMAILIISSQAIIFGFSSFSEYAESGTAILRILLHFVPVFVFTSVISANCYLKEHLDNVAAENARVGEQNITSHQNLSTVLYAAILLVSTILLSLVFLKILQGGASNQLMHVSPAEMEPVVGVGQITNHGQWRFTDSNKAVGVMRSLKPPPENTRFVSFTVSGDAAMEAVFFWIDSRHPDMLNTLKPTHEGKNLLDMSSNKSWSKSSVAEWGFVVPRENFKTVELGAVVFSQSLGWAQAPNLINQWLRPELVTQRTLNNLGRGAEHGPTWQSIVLSAAVFLLGIAVMARGLIRSSSQLAIVFLWVLSDLVWIQASIRGYLIGMSERAPTAITRNEGRHLTETTRMLRSTLDRAQPVIVLPASEAYAFEAQRLPFLMLPARSTFLPANIEHIPTDWLGSILIFGMDNSELDQKTSDLISYLGPTTVEVTYGPYFSLAHRL